MANTLRIIDGIPQVVSIDYYDQSLEVTTEIGVSGTGYDAAHIVFTLPASQTYDGTINSLIVEVNGKDMTAGGADYTYEASVTATTVTFVSAIKKNSTVRFKI